MALNGQGGEGGGLDVMACAAMSANMSVSCASCMGSL
jgi:hypothetical protein